MNAQRKPKQFLCFYDNGLTGVEETDRTPVGYGATRQDALAMGIRNALPGVAQAGVDAMRMGGFATVAQPDLSPADFAQLSKIIDDFFAGKETPNAS